MNYAICKESYGHVGDIVENNDEWDIHYFDNNWKHFPTVIGAFMLNKRAMTSDQIKRFVEGRVTPRNRDGMHFMLREVGLKEWSVTGLLLLAGGSMNYDGSYIIVMNELSQFKSLFLSEEAFDKAESRILNLRLRFGLGGV